MLRYLAILLPLFGVSSALAAEPNPVTVEAPSSKVEGRLANGVRYLIENTGSGDRIEVRIVVDVGHTSQRPDEAEFAHLMEHVLVFPQTADGRETRDIYASWGMSGQVNAWTDARATIYKYSMIGPAKAHLGDVIALLGQTMLRPRINDVVVERESAAVLAEMRESQTLRNILDVEGAAWFGEAARPQSSAALLERLPRVTARELGTFYDREYLPGRMTILIVGDVAPKAAVRLVEKAFGEDAERAAGPGAPITWQSGQPPKVARAITNAGSAEAIRLQVVRMHSPDGEIAARSPEALASAAIVQKVLGERSRLLVDRDGSPFRELQFSLNEMADFLYAPAFVTTINPKFGRIDQAVAEVETLLAQTARMGLTPEEVAAAKASLTERSLRGLSNDPVTRMQTYLERIAPPDWGNGVPEEYRDVVASIDAATVNSKLTAWLTEKPQFLSLAAPQTELIEGYDNRRIASLFQSSKSSELPPHHPVQEVAKFAMPKAPSGESCSSGPIYNGRISAYTIGCSTNVLVVGQRDTSAGMTPMVYLSGIRPRGLANLPAGRQAEAAMAVDFMDGFGRWAGLDRFARRKLLEDLHITIRLEASDEAFQVTASSPPEHAHLMMAFVGEALLHSRASETAFDDYRIDVAEGYRGGRVNPKAMSRATIRSVEAAYRNFVGGGSGFTWAVAGPYDLEEVSSALSRLQGRAPAALPTRSAIRPSVSPTDRRLDQIPADAKVVAITLRRSIASPFDERLVPTISTANGYLGRRLFNRLRVVEHGVYSVSGGVKQEPGLQRQTLEITFNCDPARADQLIAAAQQEIDRLATEMIGPEFESASSEIGFADWQLPAVWTQRIAEAVAFGTAVPEVDVHPAAVTREGIRTLFARLLADGVWEVRKVSQK